MPRSYVPSNNFVTYHKRVKAYLGVIMRHKWLTAGVAVATFIILAAPVAGLTISDILNPRSISSNEPSEQAGDATTQHTGKFINQKIDSSSQKQDKSNNTQNMISDINIDANISSSSNNTQDKKSHDADITINGQKISIPENGIIHKSYSSNSGESNIDVRIDGSSLGANSTSSSVIIEQHSTGSNDTDITRGGSRHIDRR